MVFLAEECTTCPFSYLQEAGERFDEAGTCQKTVFFCMKCINKSMCLFYYIHHHPGTEIVSIRTTGKLPEFLFESFSTKF